MELDELKKIWNETPVKNKPTTNIMELIQNKNYGPLVSLKRTYRKQITVMALLPLLLLATNSNNIEHALTSILFWSYVIFCVGVILFAFYNYQIVKRMQTMHTMVKANLEEQITLLEKRANVEIWGLRCALLFFAILVEVVPYYQHYSMLDKWHSFPVLVRIGTYTGLLLLQYFFNRQLKQQRVGRHLDYLKELIDQMQ